MLKNRIDRPLVGRKVHKLLAEKKNVALGNILETGNHPEQGCFATPRGTQQGKEFIVVNFQIGIMDCSETAEFLNNLLKFYCY